MPPVFLRPSAPSLLVKYTVLLYNIFNISPMCKRQRQFALSGLINNLNEVHTMNRTSLRRLCIAALLCAACTLMTAFLSVPTFITTVGNINLGDCVTLCACLLLGLWYRIRPRHLSGKIPYGTYSLPYTASPQKRRLPRLLAQCACAACGRCRNGALLFSLRVAALRYRRCGHQCSVQPDTAGA